MKRRTFGRFTLAAGAALATSPARAADNVLTIGGIGMLTGAGSVWGLALQGTLELAAAAVNAQGGLKVGDRTYQVKTITYDDQYTAAGSVAAYTRLVMQDGVKFVLGPISSAGIMAIKDMVEQNKTVTFGLGTSRKMLDATSRFMFRPFSTLAEYGPALVRWLAAHQPPDARRVAVFNPNDETGWDGQGIEEPAYNNNGFKVVASELYERSLKDFQPVLTKVLAAKPDVIDVGTSSPATSGLIVRQGREMGYKGRYIKMGGPGPRDIVAAAGKEAAEGMINALMGNPANPAYARLAAEFKKAKGFEPNETFIVFYDAARVLLAAIQKAGTIDDADAVRLAIPKVMPFPATQGGEITLSGKATYGVDNQFVTIWNIGEIRDGEPVAVGEVQ
jgi:branched-chain amino acid transport system substrate-binding protein